MENICITIFREEKHKDHRQDGEVVAQKQQEKTDFDKVNMSHHYDPVAGRTNRVLSYIRRNSISKTYEILIPLYTDEIRPGIPCMILNTFPEGYCQISISSKIDKGKERT